jgi:hypothetical protein
MMRLKKSFRPANRPGGELASFKHCWIFLPIDLDYLGHRSAAYPDICHCCFPFVAPFLCLELLVSCCSCYSCACALLGLVIMPDGTKISHSQSFPVDNCACARDQLLSCLGRTGVSNGCPPAWLVHGSAPPRTLYLSPGACLLCLLCVEDGKNQARVTPRFG